MLHGDDATGTLTSPEFILKRQYINLLVGGGARPGQVCVDLLCGGKKVYSATGQDTEKTRMDHLERPQPSKARKPRY